MKGIGKMEFNIWDFIDSKNIRIYIDYERIREKNFTPAQQIFLVGCSKKRSVLEKMKALEYLLSIYTKEEVDDGSVVTRSGEMHVSFYQNTVNLMKIWRELLELRNVKEGVVYAASLYEEIIYGSKLGRIKSAAGLSETEHKMNRAFVYSYFSSYEKAYAFLQEEKSFFSQKKLGTLTGVIKRIGLDEGAMKVEDEYLFNEELILWELKGREERFIRDESMVLQFYNFICYRQPVKQRIRSEEEYKKWDLGLVANLADDLYPLRSDKK